VDSTSHETVDGEEVSKRPDNVTDLPASTPYPTNVGAPKFEPLPIAELKDKDKQVAREHANQKLDELNAQWDLVMQQAELIRQQADDIVDRVRITEWVLDSRYQFSPVMGRTYYLYQDHAQACRVMTLLSPDDWSGCQPEHLEFLCAVKKLGDSTWERC
jgi:hypothetical protein